MVEYKGLTAAEAAELQKQYGFNEIRRKETSPVLDFLKRFTGLTAYVIEASLVISIILGNYIDALVMFFLLLLNAILGFSEEFRASKAIEALSKRITVKVHVLRDGVFTELPSKEIVPGDVVKLSMGDIVPADCKILEGNLLVDQSLLTGESIPKEVTTNDEVMSGTLVTRGSAVGLVEKTGENTYFGKTAELIEQAKPKLIIEEITMSVTKGLLVVDGIFIITVAAKLSLQHTALTGILPFVLTLLIASIPVALPAMTVLSLALGSLELANKGVLVRKLDGIENSAMMDVLCLDKTGTITENKIKIVDVVTVDKTIDGKTVMEFAYLSSDPGTKDPIDSAVIEFAKDKIRNNYRLIQFNPFDPDKKYSEAIVEDDKSTRFRVLKGAPQVMVGLVKCDTGKVNDLVENFAKEGKRSLAVLVSSNETDARIAGLLTFFDFPRADSKVFIEKIKAMGVSPKMITGDNLLIAKSVAKDVSIGENVVSIKELNGNKGMKVENVDAFAEVVPEDKYRIVEAYQEEGHVVGMTGDGANDAPALKKADLGIAVKDSLDIAKQSAKIILTDEGLSNIVDLITVGRKIYKRIVVWILNKVVKTFQIVFFVSIATLILNKPILTPVAMVLMIFLYDFVTMSIATDNVTPSPKPEKWNLRKLLSMSIIFGALKILELFLAMFLALKFLKVTFPELQTLMFYLLLVSGLFNVLNFREEKFFFSSKPSNPLIFAIIGDTVVATLLCTFGIFVSKAHFGLIMLTLLYALLVTLVFTDIIKIFVFKVFKY